MGNVDGKRASDKATDELCKFKCDPCARSGLVKEASTLCKQCEEYMCVTCASIHNGLQLARNHNMVSGSDLALTGQSLAASRSTRPESTGQSVAASRSTRPESTGHSVAASRSTGPESTGQSVAASRSTRPESTGHSVAASRSTRPESTGQSVAASRSTHPESSGQPGVDQPVATSHSTCPDSGRKSWLHVKVVSSTVINGSSNDVRDSAVMPDGRVILADGKYAHIILLHKDFTVQWRLPLKVKPWALAVYEDNVAVVTLPDMEQLQYIHVGTTLRAGRTIPTGLTCRGMAVHDGEIYVGVEGGQYGGHVQVMDTRGNVTRRIGADVHGRDRRYILPSNITVGTSGNVYVSDFVSDHIACYTSTGDVVYDVKHEGMLSPTGMLVDKDGNLLVCCCGSSTIQLLGKDGAHLRIVLSPSDGMMRPQSMSYRRSYQTLVVTMWNITPSVSAYKLN